MSSFLRRLADNSSPQGGQQNGHAPQAPVPPGPFPNSVATPPPAPDHTPRPQVGVATSALTNTLPPQPPGVTDALPTQQQIQGTPTSHLGPSPTPHPQLTQVPPQLVSSLVQRILSGFPQNATLDKTPEMEQMLAGRFMAVLPQVSGNLTPGGQEALFSAVMDEILGFG
ncbi:MAG TPA: hypothetical protein VEX13_06205, partial [Chloroflexia bacterium]|nr:hypothetical protein [Chloroflexia bacterium]